MPHGTDELPSATWEDIKQVAYGLLMVAPFIALFAYGARVIVGQRAAFWLGLGLMCFAIVAYGSVVIASLAISYGFDMGNLLARWLERRRAR